MRYQHRNSHTFTQKPHTLAAFVVLFAFLAAMMVLAFVTARQDEPEPEPESVVQSSEFQPPKGNSADWPPDPKTWPEPTSRGKFASRRGYPYAERLMPARLIDNKNITKISGKRK